MTFLQIENLSRRFGSVTAVDDVSLGVEPGEFLSVIGPNGAGKTTLFNMITGLIRPTSGQVSFEDRDITYLPAARRVQLGLVRTFQITEIFPELTVHDNIKIGVEVAAGQRWRPWLSREERQLNEKRVFELLEIGALSNKADRVAGELAHGDQRATEIMMALSLRPRLLLLDEPTAGMGDEETYLVTRLIGRLHRRQKLTIILIEHDMRVVFHLAKRVIVLAEGKILAEGSPEQIAANESVQSAYLGKAA
jgi:branched-chain amino acid transport system ATP-binding protein